MSVYPNYYNAYQPLNQQYQQQYTPQYQIPQIVPQQQNVNSGSSINWVQGEAGAKSYLVTAGQSVLLMDSEKSSFYIKSTDPSGMPLPLRIFDYTERNTVQNTPEAPANSIDMGNYITRQEFEEKISQLISKKEDSVND